MTTPSPSTRISRATDRPAANPAQPQIPGLTAPTPEFELAIEGTQMVGNRWPGHTPNYSLIPQPSPQSFQWWYDNWDRYNWRFAKTMPNAPHSYVVRGQDIHPQDYWAVWAMCAIAGTSSSWYGKTRRYLRIPTSPVQFWFMSDFPQQSRILNVAVVPDGKIESEDEKKGTK